jgi:hypothetical protein
MEVGMLKVTYISALAAGCLVAGLTGSIPEAKAGVMPAPSQGALGASTPVENVYHRYWRHHHYGRYGYWRHRHYYRHYGYWRHHHYYRHYGYYYNPAGALAGAAVGLATAPLWAFGGWPGWGGYPFW